MDEYYDFFWYQLCIRIQSLRDYNTSTINNTARTYNLDPVFYMRIDFDKQRAYISLHDVIDEHIVSIERYSYYAKVYECVEACEDKADIQNKLTELADDTLGNFILKYRDSII